MARKKLNLKLTPERQELFTTELPKWEVKIRSMSYQLLNTRTIDRGLLGQEDIENMLRVALVKAIRDFKEGKGMKLSSWILHILKQECSLITENHYNKVPRADDAPEEEDKEEGRKKKKKKEGGTPLYLEPLYRNIGGEEVALELEDLDAFEKMQEYEEQEAFNRDAKLVYKALKPGFERRCYKLLLTENWSDNTIAKYLGVNFAKVGEVRFKAALAFAVLRNIPIAEFTNAKNAKRIQRRMHLALQQQMRLGADKERNIDLFA